MNLVESTFWKSDAVVTRKAAYRVTANKDGLSGKKTVETFDGTSEVKGVI